MLAIGHGPAHVVSYLTIAAGAAVGIVTFTSGFAITADFVARIADRRRITYRLSFCTSLVRSVVPGLGVSFEGQELADPHVLGIELVYRGRGDITGGSFEEGQPFRVDVGAPAVSVIGKEFTPPQGPHPEVEASGKELLIGPGMVRSGQVIRLTVLADGAAGRLDHESPLANVSVRQRAAEAEHGWIVMQVLTPRKVVTWVLVMFIVYYLVSDPGGAAGAVHHALNGLQEAGNSLSRFVSGL